MVDIPVIISATAPNTQLSDHYGYLSGFYMTLRIPYHAQGIIDLILFLKLPVVAKRLKLSEYNKSIRKQKKEASKEVEVKGKISMKHQQKTNKTQTMSSSSFSNSVNHIADDFIEDNLQTIELKENSSYSSHASINTKLIQESKEKEGVSEEDEEEGIYEDILGSVDNIDMEDITILDESESFENPVVSRPNSTNDEL